MILRLALPDDVPALSDLGRRAFIVKFGHLYSSENLARFLDDAHSVEHVAEEICAPDMRVAIIDVDGAITAFCKVLKTSGLPRHTTAQAPAELKQLYTDPDLVGRGHGARLMEWAMDQARNWSADELQISVYAHNLDAQRFYRRYGMEKVADIEFWVGNHCDPESMFAGPV